MRAEDWKGLVAEYKAIVADQWKKPFPQDVNDQLWGAISAVFGSWQAERAKVYRRLNSIPGDWRTAVNVQAMVFGKMGDTPATGVAFTRTTATGQNFYYCELLIKTPGGDVGPGIRRPHYNPHHAAARAGAETP